MDIKRGLILVFTVLLVVINIAHFIVISSVEESLFTGITGKAAGSSQGTSSICIDKPPTLTAIADQSATIGTAFSLQVSASDAGENSLAYSDNTSLFDISSTGLISFTPAAATTETVLITVSDNTGCASYSVADAFTITITSAEAPPPAAPPAAGGGGGAGAGGSPPSEEVEVSFDVSDHSIRVSLRESRGMERRVTITNDGTATLEMEVINPLSEILHITPSSFTLLPGNDQELRFVFNPRLSAEPDIYSGTVEVQGAFGARVTEDIFVVVEIESDKVVVDASLDLLTKALSRGEDLTATVTLFNLREITEAEVDLIYLISAVDQSIVYEERETISLRDQVSFSKRINLPDGLPPGTYLFSLKVVYEDTLSTASDTFIIEAPEAPAEAAPPSVGLAAVFAKVPYLAYSLPVMMILLVVILIVLYLLHQRVRKHRGPAVKEKIVKLRTIIRPTIQRQTIVKPTTIIKRRTIIKPTTIIQRKTIIKPDDSGLKRKLSLLKESYRRGYIHKETYRETRAKIRRMMGKG